MSVLQDGPAAGQTVPHVHIHVLPRKLGDFEPNDKIYDALDNSSKEDAANRCCNRGCSHYRVLQLRRAGHRPCS